MQDPTNPAPKPKTKLKGVINQFIGHLEADGKALVKTVKELSADNLADAQNKLLFNNSLERAAMQVTACQNAIKTIKEAAQIRKGG